MRPEIAIVMPNFNRADTIGESIESVISQEFRDWELIIVDDGSTDESWELIQAYCRKDPRIKAFKRDSGPKGPSRCRNIGVGETDAVYLIFLDSDDLLAVDCLHNRINCMQASPHLDMAIFPAGEFDVSTGGIRKLYKQLPDDIHELIRSFLRCEPPFVVFSPIWRTSFFKMQGGFNEQLTIMEDPELHLRSLLSGPQLQIDPGATPDAFYRKHSFNEAKKAYFNEYSITGRITYIRQAADLIRQHKEYDCSDQKLLSHGIHKLLKHFLLGRIKDYYDEYKELIHWARRERIIGPMVYIDLLIMGKVYYSDSRLVKILRLKGIIYRLHYL